MAASRGDVFERGLTGWLYNYVARNFWRVSSWIEFEDLIQDGMEIILVLRIRYPNVRDSRHFMALYKRCVMNHVYTLARKKKRLNEVPACEICTENREEAFWESLLDGTAYPAGVFAVLLRQAPPELKKLLSLFMTDTGRRKLCALYRFVNGMRETTNDRLCRLAGLDPTKVNAVALIRSHFGPDDSYIDSHTRRPRMFV